MNKKNGTEQKLKQRKPLPKAKMLSNTKNLASNIGGDGSDANVITRTCSQGGGCQTNYCTYRC